MSDGSASVPAPDSALTPPPPRSWKIGRIHLEIRQHTPGWQQLLYLVGSALLGLVISGIILVVAGVPASDVADEFIVETLFDMQNLLAVLTEAAPLIAVGLSASLAFRVRFWNLGIEGQMIWGAIAATTLSLFHIGPDALRLPLMMVAAALAGVIWVSFAALLKMRYRVNEIIATLLMNYFAVYFLYDLLYGAWADPNDGMPHSALYAKFERFPEIAGGINATLPVALILAAIITWLVHGSRAGFYMKFVQANDRMALMNGVPILRVTLLAVLVSGALSGLAGMMISAATEGRLNQGFYEGYGFSGVLIAFLSRNRPAAATLVAFLMSVLFIGSQGLQVFYQIPFAMVQLIQAIIVLCVAASEFLIRHRIHWTR